MVLLLVVLLIVFLALGGVGFAVKGLIWLAILGLALFVITGIIGLLGRGRGWWKTLGRRR